MKCYCYDNDAVKVLQMLKRMQQHGYIPDVFEFNIVFDVFGRLGQLGKILEFWDEMLAAGVKPNDVTYSIILERFVDAGWWEQAVMFYEKAVDQGELGHWSVNDPGHVE